MVMTMDELRSRAGKLPRVSLTRLPTPLDELPRFAKAVGHGVRFFMKRDDVMNIGFGGNKLRKLEFTLGAMKAEGYDVLVHGLAGQSNYCRQTAAAAAKVGVPCHLVLRRDHKAEDPAQSNRLLDYVYGAKVHMVADREEQAAAKQALVARLIAEGHKPYLVGERDEAFGGVAYALCLAEILEQLAAVGAKADCVCVSGRAGTSAGLILGKRLLGFEGPILGFQVAPESSAESTLRQSQACVAAANEAARMLGLNETFAVSDVINTDAYGGVKYGTPTEAGLNVLLELARTEGINVGPVYTGKGLSGVVDYIRTGKIAKGSTVVFIHTGGTPELFAYNAEIMEHIRQKEEA